MQELSTLLSGSISKAPGQMSGSNRGQSPMNYLLVPISEALLERVQMTYVDGARWRWLDFYPAPACFAKENMFSGSLFDLSLTDYTENSFDGIVVNLQLSWLNFDQLFRQCQQLLKPGGHFYFSTFGPDTLFQLRELWQRSDNLPHVHDFADLHELGDRLARCGYEKPILDTDWMGVEYEDIDLLMSDLRRQGFGNSHQDRRRCLTGKGRLNAIKQQFEQQKPVQMTFEIIYGYARKSYPKSDSIRVTVPSVT